MATLPGFGTRLQGAGLAHVLVKVRIRLFTLFNLRVHCHCAIKNSVGSTVAQCLSRDQGIVNLSFIGVTALCP